MRIKLKMFNNPGPAEQLILSTARDQWRLVAVNLGSSLLEAFSEGAALAVVFMAVQVLSSDQHYNWASNPAVSTLPALVELMNGLPRIPLFLGLLALSVLFQIVQSGARYANALSVGYLSARCRAQIMQRIHSLILSFSYPCASGYRVGDLTDLLGLGPGAVNLAISRVSALGVNGLLVVVYLAVLVTLSPWLLVLAAVLGITITLVQRRLLPRIGHLARQVSGDQRNIAAQVTEHIQGLRLLHSSGTLDAADQLVASKMANFESSLRLQAQLMELIGPITQLLPVLAIAVLGGISVLVYGHKSSGILPSLITFVLALQRLNTRASAIARIYTDLKENSGRMDRLDGLLRVSDKDFRRRGGVPFQGLQHTINFENVSLRYVKDAPYSLKGINLSIRKGETIALVGPSGAGKSSIADLLVGLYQPSSGRIHVDGTDLQQLELSSWQHRMGIVSQDTFLFNASIAENIAYGCPLASRSQIQEAAAAAQANHFILDLPHGYDTLVGERGYRLSGGQRQRLSLARAILRQPDLLILDEATSALDSKSEQLVQEAVESLPYGITKLVIAHRLSTVFKADQIVVLQRGIILQHGKHSELMNDLTGLYRSLWLYQGGLDYVSHWKSFTSAASS